MNEFIERTSNWVIWISRKFKLINISKLHKTFVIEVCGYLEQACAKDRSADLLQFHGLSGLQTSFPWIIFQVHNGKSMEIFYILYFFRRILQIIKYS